MSKLYELISNYVSNIWNWFARASSEETESSSFKELAIIFAIAFFFMVIFALIVIYADKTTNSSGWF